MRVCSIFRNKNKHYIFSFLQMRLIEVACDFFYEVEGNLCGVLLLQKYLFYWGVFIKTTHMKF